MKSTDALPGFLTAVDQAGLSATRLDPWSAWKLFKRFVHRELEDAYDTAAFQFVRFELEPDGGYLAAFLVWQFTERDWGPGHHGEDELVGRLVIELQYPVPERLALPDLELWSMDFPTLEEWATVVEGLPQFQEVINREPIGSSVSYDHGE